MVTLLRGYQYDVIDQWTEIVAAGGTRATIVLPTAAGKTVVAARLMPDATDDRNVFFVPTVVLLDQTRRHLLRQNPKMRVLRVCSRTAPAGEDCTEAEAAGNEEIDATTDPDVIAAELRAPGPLTVVATYASAPAVFEAAQGSGTVFSLCVCDEAHRTAGVPGKAWSLPVRDEFPAKLRLFMTATPRTISVPATPEAAARLEEGGWNADDVMSMDSLEKYGPHIAPLTFRRAIEKGWLSDYEIAVIGVTTKEARRQLNRMTKDGPCTLSDAATHLALIRAAETHPQIQSVLAFHNRTETSNKWIAQLLTWAEVIGDRKVTGAHIDGNTKGSLVREALAGLANPGDGMHVVSNCRVFGEGVDVPELDAVIFAAPRTSSPDIVQIAGRAMRPHPNDPERKALIVVPILLVGDVADSAADAAAARTTHFAAWQILTSLADQDEVLHDALLTWRDDVKSPDSGSTSGPMLVDMPDELSEVAQKFFLRTIDRTIPSHLRTATYLRQFYAVHGHTRTKPHTVFKEFPLGMGVRAAQAAKQAGALPPKIIEEFEKIDGFAWVTTQSAARRTSDEWITLIKVYVTKTGIRVIARHTIVIDPNTKLEAKIGEWYHTKALRKNYLTEQQRNRLNNILDSNDSDDGQ